MFRVTFYPLRGGGFLASREALFRPELEKHGLSPNILIPYRSGRVCLSVMAIVMRVVQVIQSD
jgi:hypothetical protein